MATRQHSSPLVSNFPSRSTTFYPTYITYVQILIVFACAVFAFSGFEQPNYVLGEIRRPRKTFPRATAVGVLTACLLYVAVNVSYVSQIQCRPVCQPLAKQTFRWPWYPSRPSAREHRLPQARSTPCLSRSNSSSWLTATRPTKDATSSMRIPAAKATRCLPLSSQYRPWATSSS
jgi:hypothetical protein